MTGHGGLRFLLEQLEAEEAERMRRRLNLDDEVPSTPRAEWAVPELTRMELPVSVLLWLLECDDPTINEAVYGHPQATATIKRDIQRGVPFGPDPQVRIPVSGEVSKHAEADRAHSPAVYRPLNIEALREATTAGRARSAVLPISSPHWPKVARADRDKPLPAPARWELVTRVDCPPELRQQFRSGAKFRRRMRQAGVLSGPADYLDGGRPAATVLAVLDLGRAVFLPHRSKEAALALQQLIRGQLGGNGEAWKMFAHLLPSFAGTMPELTRTTRAIVGAR